ncbi:MAG: ribbon-helix-helix domain-containing protein [bacterium]
MPKDKRVTIKIPRHLYERLKQMVEGTGFSSVNEFIVFVMRDIASGGRLDQEGGLSKQEIEQVRKRLRALGYLPDENRRHPPKDCGRQGGADEEIYSVEEEEKIRKRLKDLGYI